MLYAWEVWPVNWRVAVENAGDAHVPYVHRDAALVLMNPFGIMGPRGLKTDIVNGRTATFNIARTAAIFGMSDGLVKKDGNGTEGSANGAQPPNQRGRDRHSNTTTLRWEQNGPSTCGATSGSGRSPGQGSAATEAGRMT